MGTTKFIWDRQNSFAEGTQKEQRRQLMVPGQDESADGFQQTKVYHLERTIDIIGTIVASFLYAGCAAVLAGVAVFDPAPDSYVLLVPAAGFLAYTIHVLRQDMPLNASVQISDIGITAKAWFQAERLVSWSDITGVVWIEKRLIGRHGIQWLYSLFLEVPEYSYRRRRIKLGNSIRLATIGQLRDEIVNRCGLKEVHKLRIRPLFFWHSTKRRIWRRSANQMTLRAIGRE